MTARPFRFGVQVSNPPDGTDYGDVARHIEGLGYSTASVSDHFTNSMAPIPMLAVMAAATTELRIGSLVFCNDFRHPADLASAAATIDVLSNGRLEFGIGAGWMTTDYEQTGIPHDSAGVRIDRMAEAVSVIKGLWSDSACTYSGEHYTISEMQGSPKPVQKPHPPFLIGGGGPKMLRTAAQHADIVGVNAALGAGVIDERAGRTATLERTQEKIEWIREAAGDRFSAIELQARVHVATVTDDAPGWAEIMGPALGLTPQEALESPHSLGGSVEEIIEKLHRLREQFGLSYFTWNIDAADALAPVVARLAGT